MRQPHDAQAGSIEQMLMSLFGKKNTIDSLGDLRLAADPLSSSTFRPHTSIDNDFTADLENLKEALDATVGVFRSFWDQTPLEMTPELALFSDIYQFAATVSARGGGRSQKDAQLCYALGGHLDQLTIAHGRKYPLVDLSRLIDEVAEEGTSDSFFSACLEAGIKINEPRASNR